MNGVFLRDPLHSSSPLNPVIRSLLLFLFSCVSALFPLFSQSQDVALLVNGPKPGRGLPFLRSNVIEYFKGEYRYQEQRIFLYYTEREIVRFENWQPVDCGTTRFFRLNEELIDRYEGLVEGSVPREIYFFQNEEYALFFAFDGELNCTFARRFLSRFTYFRSVEDFPSSRPAFPAVVD